MLNNQGLNQVTGEMRAMQGAPQFEPSQGIPDLPYADIARLFGLDGVRVERPEDVEPAWRQALAATGPSSSTSAPTRRCRRSRRTPPGTRSRQRRCRSSEGDSDRASMVKEGVRAKIQEFLPGGGRS